MKKSEIFSKLDEQRRIEDKSQEEMAKEIGVSPTSYNNYRMGKTEPSEDVLMRMFKYLKDNTRTVMIAQNDEEEEPIYLAEEESIDYLIENYSHEDLMDFAEQLADKMAGKNYLKKSGEPLTFYGGKRSTNQEKTEKIR